MTCWQQGSTARTQALRAVLAASLLLAALAASGTQIQIVEPAPQQTVHDNAGNVDVRIAVSLEPARGENVELLLDGQPVARAPRTEFHLGGVQRGQHTLQARLLDRHGRTLDESEPLTFHMWQASRLFNNRQRGH